MIIKSADNNKFKIYKSLLNKKGINQHSLCLVMGRKIAPEYINHQSVVEIIATENNCQHINSNALIVFLQKNLFNQIDITGTDFPLSLIHI